MYMYLNTFYLQAEQNKIYKNKNIKHSSGYWRLEVGRSENNWGGLHAEIVRHSSVGRTIRTLSETHCVR